MLSLPDFKEKQIVFVFFNNEEKMSFSNDNLIIRNADGTVKLQTTCYRLFAIYVVGNCSITTVLIQKARRYGFFIMLFTSSFRLYEIIGAEKEGNTLLKKKQYYCFDINLSKYIVKNKIATQYESLKSIREKDSLVYESMNRIASYYELVDLARDINEIMSYEGQSSKMYFKCIFVGMNWNGRKPRTKCSPINTVMDIGYTVLFSFIDSIVSIYGFDTYCGILHRQFYMRKSLVCDLIEPFRFLIDKAIVKAYNLGQISEEDFILENHQYKLKWENSSKYISFLMKPIVDNKDEIFKFIQSYYRNFMKNSEITLYPFYTREGVIEYGTYKL